MATVKYNVYYSTSPTGPWTLANPSPITRVATGNSFTVENLRPGTTYHFSVVGGIENDDGDFIALITQPIGPNSVSISNPGAAPLPNVMVKIPASRTLGESLLTHEYGIPAPDIELLQQSTNNSGGGGVTSLAVTLGDTPTDSSLLVMVVGRQSSAGIVNSITQTGATWVKAVSEEALTNQTRVEIWYAKNISGAGTTATINFSTFSVATGILAEYAGIDITSPLDQTATAVDDSGSATGSTGTTSTTTQADELFIGGMCGIANPQFNVPTNGFDTIPFRNLFSKNMRDSEAAVATWTGFNVTATQDGVTTTEGSFSTKIVLDSEFTTAQSEIVTIAGGTYNARLSIWAPLAVTFALGLTDTDNSINQDVEFIVGTDDWQDVEFSHTFPPETTNIAIRINCPDGGSTVYVDKTQIMRGEDVGSWIGNLYGTDPVTSSILETMLYDKIVSSVGTAGTEVSFNASAVWVGAMATFKRRIS